jgi:molecular chaperone DnaK (HSP70)
MINVLGIDLGTTNSCVSVWRDNNIEIIPDKYGNRTMPSIVAFSNITKYVGIEAKNQTDINPENTIYEVKRLIGRKYNDSCVLGDLPFLTYEIDKTETDEIIIRTNDNNVYTPEEICSIILSKIKNYAEAYLNEIIQYVVITVPAYFSDAQRQATKDAATIAGLDCIRIINEPTAAALAYGLNFHDEDKTVIVYDLGGGTLDVSLLNISEGLIEVLSSSGNTHMGGSDFDNKLIMYTKECFMKKNKIDNLDNINLLSLQILKKKCEDAKIMLSLYEKVPISINNFYNNIDLKLWITRNKFCEICRDLFIFCLKPISDVLESADCSIDEIDDVVLVGGTTKMKMLRDNLKMYFHGKELNTSVNPDEVVAIGAGIQGFILKNNQNPFSDNIVLLDISPLSLGVEVIGEEMNIIIPRNSTIPIKKKKIFSTDSDNETSVTIKIFEGERKMTIDNTFVGKFDLSGIEPAPRGVAKIEITFAIDVNGIVSVTAVDKNNCNNIKQICVKGNKNRLTKKEIKNLVNISRKMESDDIIVQQKKRLHYDIEDLCSNILANLNNNNFHLKHNDKNDIIDKINEFNYYLEEKKYYMRDIDELTDKKDSLMKSYGVLVLKSNEQNTNIRGACGDDVINMTTVIDINIDTDSNNYDNMNMSDKLNNLDNLEDELQEKINEIMNMCYSLSEMIDVTNIDMKNLKDYINDIMLWVHVDNNITAKKIDKRIEQINLLCSDIDAECNINFEDIPLINKIEYSCYSLKSFIECNMFSNNETDVINNYINIVLDYLVEINNNNNNDNDSVINNKLINHFDNINNYYNDLSKSIIGINYDHDNDNCNIKKSCGTPINLS